MPRPRADWVYRASIRDSGGVLRDNLGTYEQNIETLSSGAANARAFVLYDSANYRASVARAGALYGQPNPGYLPGEATAAGRKALIRRVEGIVYMEPSTWAVGNLIATGWRIGVFEQDRSGDVLVPAAYSMWAQVAANIETPALFANFTRMNVKERRIHYGFSDNQAFVVPRITWRGRRRLEDNECFAIWLESETTSVNLRMQLWIRTLVEDG